jgi:DNA-binding response OmpR family regulator
VIAASVARGLTADCHANDNVGDGEAANEWDASDPYHAVILDVILPGSDGF